MAMSVTSPFNFWNNSLKKATGVDKSWYTASEVNLIPHQKYNINKPTSAIATTLSWEVQKVTFHQIQH